MSDHARVNGRLWLVLALTAALGTSIFWIGHYIPFQDLVAQAGVSAIRARIHASPVLSKNYMLGPEVGSYFLFRLIADTLGAHMNRLAVMRVFGTLAFLAAPTSLVAARLILVGKWDARAGLVGACLGLGLMTLLGFANFQIGEGTAIVAWAALVRANTAETRGAVMKWLALGAALAALTMLWHGFALALCGLAFAASFAVLPTRRWMTWLAWAPAGSIAIASVIAERSARMAADAGLGAHHGLGFQNIVDKISLLFSVTLMTRSGVDIVVGIGLWALVIAYAVRAYSARVWSGPGATERALFAAWASMVVLFAALPHTIGWFGFVDGRVAPLIVAFAALSSLTWADANKRWLGYARTVLVALGPVAIAANDVRCSIAFQDEARGFDEVAEHIPSGARVLNLPLDPDSRIFAVHPFVHYDKLLLTTRDVVPSDVWFHAGTAVYATPENPARRLPASYSESNLKVVEWDQYTSRDWDYALMREKVGDAPPQPPPHLTLEAHAGGWWLFRFAS